jgi:hypothetical protein
MKKKRRFKQELKSQAHHSELMVHAEYFNRNRKYNARFKKKKTQEFIKTGRK